MLRTEKRRNGESAKWIFGEVFGVRVCFFVRLPTVVNHDISSSKTNFPKWEVGWFLQRDVGGNRRRPFARNEDST